jgi:hypothetical protein
MTYVENILNNPNPNYQNFLGLVDEVLRFGFNDGPQVNRNRIKAWINEALFQIAREVQGPEWQATEDLEMESGVYKYPLPEDFLRMQDIFYPEMRMRLRLLDLQQFDLHSPTVISGPPSMYTLYASELWLFPNPNTNDTLELRYIRNPPQLTEDTDVPLLAPNYWHLLVDYAVSKAFRAEDDLEAAQAHMQLYKGDLAAFATDVQNQTVDRPRVLDGTWSAAASWGGYT